MLSGDKGTEWTSQLCNAFQLSSRIKYYYKRHSSIGAPYEPVSTNGLLQIIHEVTGWKIKIVEIDESIDWNPRHFKGCILKNPDDKMATVIIPPLSVDQSAGVTRCERRFAVVKEICHLLVDVPGTEISSLSSLAIKIVSSGQTLIPIGQRDPIITQEYIAEVAALELLFWSEKRAAFFAKVNAGEMSDLDVAKRYLVPECKIANLRAKHDMIEMFRNGFWDVVDELIHVGGAIPTDLNGPFTKDW